METNNTKLIYFALGLGAGLLAMHFYDKKRMEKKIALIKEDAHESGYIEAHQNFNKVLNHVHLNHGSPADVFRIING